ncbi:hypothetical protein Shyhy01_66930 [Streptomyces hygroscopicus subsp. hygroscopicus]|nr:hypothetical protein Shyhy01_66930 [Streptomyces hygroscopicus subsp. hygroscopicus]
MDAVELDAERRACTPRRSEAAPRPPGGGGALAPAPPPRAPAGPRVRTAGAPPMLLAGAGYRGPPRNVGPDPGARTGTGKWTRPNPTE